MNLKDQSRLGEGGSKMTGAIVNDSLTPFQVMPSLTEDEYAGLREDIATNGVLVPILVDQHGMTPTATTAPKSPKNSGSYARGRYRPQESQPF